jgi:RNA polymerase sigma-70 factor (ECF subfamily)
METERGVVPFRPMPEPATSDLVRAAAAGDSVALDALYVRVAPRLLTYIRLRMGRSLRARVESRDILQSALLKSFQRFDDFRGHDGRSLVAWLARIAKREVADRVDYEHRQRRDAARETPLESSPDLAARVTSVLSRVIRDERAEELEAAMDTLSDAHREIILLRKFEELSFPEIARRLSKSEDACRMLFARALTSLTLALAAPPAVHDPRTATRKTPHDERSN